MSKQNNGASIVVAVLVTLAVAGVGGYMLGKRTGEAAGRLEAPVANVNGEAITRAELLDRLILQPENLNVLDLMINDKLVELAARKANVNVTSADVQAEIDKLRNEMGGDMGLEMIMSQNGLTMDELKLNVLTYLRATKILTQNLPQDDATLETWFSMNSSHFDRREAHSRHILVHSEEEARQVRQSLDSGIDFAELAKAKSTDKVSAEEGGDLGTNPRGRMVAEFDDVLFSLRKGEISQPFQTQFGWHVVQLLDITGEVPSFQAIKEEVRSAYINEQLNMQYSTWMTELRENARITNSLTDK